MAFPPKFAVLVSQRVYDWTRSVAKYGDNCQSTISGNALGMVGAAMSSYGDNDMNGNTECDMRSTINPAPHDQ